MLTVIAFIVALGLLIAVHEYGHYRVAVACGVKVLRFSIGFGKTLYSWKPRKPRAGPGHRVRDRRLPAGWLREDAGRARGPGGRGRTRLRLQHPAAEVARRHRGRRPGANLLLAMLLYAAVNWMGVQEPQPSWAARWPIRSRPKPACAAANACERAGFEGDAVQPCAPSRNCAGCSRAARSTAATCAWCSRAAAPAASARWCCRLSRLDAVTPTRSCCARSACIVALEPAGAGRGDGRAAPPNAPGLRKGDVRAPGRQPAGRRRPAAARPDPRQVQGGRPCRPPGTSSARAGLQVQVTPDVVTEGQATPSAASPPTWARRRPW
jgi:hypothetical protein